MSKVAFALLWCFAFVIPWEEVVYLPMFGSVPRLVGVVACTVGGLYVLARGTVRPLSSFHVLAALFVLWTGMSGFWSIDPEATRVRFVTYVQLAVLAWLIWELASAPGRQRALLQAYVLGAGIGALGIIHSYLSGAALDPQAARFSGLNANPNELGLTLVVGIPIAWCLAIGQPHRRNAWMWHLYLPLAITAVFLTASRGAFVAAVVALLIIPWTLRYLRLRTTVVLCGLAIGSVALAGSLAPEASLQRIRTTPSDMAAGSFGGRGVIWKSGLQVVQEHPLVGVGAGAFGAAVEPMLRTPWTAHTTFLAILAEEGVVGLVLFLAMVATTVTPLARLPNLQMKLAVVLLAVLAVGSLSIAWDYHKQLWLVLGLLAVQVAPQVALRVAAPAAGRMGGKPPEAGSRSLLTPVTSRL